MMPKAKQVRSAFKQMQNRKTMGESPAEFLASDGNVIAWRFYDHFLREANAMDFDDMLLHTRDLLKKDKSIVAKVISSSGYMLIDEYQDSNPVQVDLSLNEMMLDLSILGGCKMPAEEPPSRTTHAKHTSD